MYYIVIVTFNLEQGGRGGGGGGAMTHEAWITKDTRAMFPPGNVLTFTFPEGDSEVILK